VTYTQIVAKSKRQAVALLALVALMGLPVTGTLCTLWCTSEDGAAHSSPSTDGHHASTGAPHHHTGAEATDERETLAVRVLAPLPATCTTHIGEAESTATLTASWTGVGQMTGTPASAFELVALATRRIAANSGYRSPPVFPDTSSPVVLRI
jgi:hypothetical protein